MKRSIPNGALDDVKFYCDKHPDRECFSELKTTSWYGSTFDLTGVEIHLCDACLFDLYKQFQKEFGISPKDLDI